MKKLLLLLCSLLPLAAVSSAATISGTLVDSAGSNPISGQKIYFIDSLSSSVLYVDSTTTNSSGNYSFTIPATSPWVNLILYTATCGGTSLQHHYYSGSSISVPNWKITTAYMTFSGTAFYKNRSRAAGINVYIMGSGSPAPVVNSAGANAVTDANGNYTAYIPCNWTGGWISMQFENANCLTGWWGFSWSGHPVTGRVDTFYCPQVSGHVTKQGGGVAGNAKVYLINVEVDTTTIPATKTLKAIDSTTSNANGRYTFQGKIGTLIKAALQPSDVDYLNFLPTYYDSSLLWSGADTVDLAQWNYLDSNVSISLRGGANPGGPGFIGGDVLVGANKSTAVGDPLEGKILLLTTAAGKAVSYTYSDASGHFSFSNLPLGSYLLFGDAGGKLNPALSIVLTAGNTSVSNVIFEENNVRFEGHLNTLGVTGQSAMESVRLYPSPAKSHLYFGGMSGIKGEKNVEVFDLRGAVVLRTKLQGTSMKIGDLPGGVYLLHLQTEEGVANFRFIKE